MEKNRDYNNPLHSFLSKTVVQNVKTGAIGKVVNEMNSFDPPQFGVQWLAGASKLNFPWGHYWNDKADLKVLGKKLPEDLMNEYNSHEREFRHLYELCEKDLLLVETVYAVLKANSCTMAVPYDKKELMSVLNFKPFKSWDN